MRKFLWSSVATLSFSFFLSVAPNKVLCGDGPQAALTQETFDSSYYEAPGQLRKGALVQLGQEWKKLIQDNQLEDPTHQNSHNPVLYAWAKKTALPYISEAFQKEAEEVNAQEQFSLNYYHTLVLRSLPDPQRESLKEEEDEEPAGNDLFFVLSKPEFVSSWQKSIKHLQTLRERPGFSVPFDFFYVYATEFFELKELSRCFQSGIYPVEFDPHNDKQIAHTDEFSGSFRVAIHDILHAGIVDFQKKGLRQLFAISPHIEALHDNAMDFFQTVALEPREEVGEFFVFHELNWVNQEILKAFMQDLEPAKSINDVLTCYEKATLSSLKTGAEFPEFIRKSRTLTSLRKQLKKDSFAKEYPYLAENRLHLSKIRITKENNALRATIYKNTNGIEVIIWELLMQDIDIQAEQNAQLHTKPLLQYAGLWKEGDTIGSMSPKLRHCIRAWADKIRTTLPEGSHLSSLEQKNSDDTDIIYDLSLLFQE